MSFLNPVNEPVLRFSSTDAGAPQINYAARTAGDVKTVLKACLVTGYGAKAGAGWTAVNETATVIEFVSPSAAMSDYRLGIDDTSASSTTWYYQYQDARVNPLNNSITKNFTSCDKVSASNGWQVIVSNQAFVLIEHVYSTGANAVVSRVTYFGALKSFLDSAVGENIGFWNIGWNASSQDPARFFTTPTNTYFKISDKTSITLSSVNISKLGDANNTPNLSISTDMSSHLFLKDSKNDIIAQHPALLNRVSSNQSMLLGIYDTSIAGRPCLYAAASFPFNSDAQVRQYARGFLFALDYWEF